MISELLSTDGFVMVNRRAAQRLGVDAAMLLGELCFRQNRAGDERFAVKLDELAKRTYLSKERLIRAMKALEGAGLVDVCREGLPRRNWYRVREGGLTTFFASSPEIETASGDAEAMGETASSPEIETAGSAKIPTASIFTVNKDLREKKIGRFTPPSVTAVRDYCAQRGFHFDPEAFVAFYESKGWKVGKAPMKSWKAACVTWERRCVRDAESGGAAGVERAVRQVIDATGFDPGRIESEEW